MMLAARCVKAGATTPLQHSSAKISPSFKLHRNFKTHGFRLLKTFTTANVIGGLSQNRGQKSNFATSSAVPDQQQSTAPSFVVSSDWERFGFDLTNLTSELDARGPLEPVVAKFFTSGELPNADLYGFDPKFAAEYIQDDPERTLCKSVNDLVRANIEREVLLKAYRLDQEEASFDLRMREELEDLCIEAASSPLTPELVQRRRDQKILRTFGLRFAALCANSVVPPPTTIWKSLCKLALQCQNESYAFALYRRAVESHVEIDAEFFLIALRAAEEAEDAFRCWGKLLQTPNVKLQVAHVEAVARVLAGDSEFRSAVPSVILEAAMRDVKPSALCYRLLMDAQVATGRFAEASAVLQEAKELGHEISATEISLMALREAAARNSSTDLKRHWTAMKSRQPPVPPTVEHFAVMLENCESLTDAIDLHKDMQALKIEHTSSTLDALLRVLGEEGKTAEHLQLGKQLFERYASPPIPFPTPLSLIPASIRPPPVQHKFDAARSVVNESHSVFPDAEFAHLGPKLLGQFSAEKEAAPDESYRVRVEQVAAEYLALRNTLEPLRTEISKLRSGGGDATKENASVASVLEEVLEKRVAQLREMWPLVDEQVLEEYQANQQTKRETSSASAAASEPKGRKASVADQKKSSKSSSAPQRGYSTAAQQAKLPPVAPKWGYVDFSKKERKKQKKSEER